MTTMTLKIDDNRQDIVEAFQVIVSNFQGVSYEISQDTNKKDEVLSSLSQTCKDIKSGKAIKEAKPIGELFKELAND